MEGTAIAFMIWETIGALIVLGGIYTMHSKRTRPFGFWANAEVFDVKDVKAYNKALGKLWIVFGMIFALLGMPFLAGQNSGYVVATILGTMVLAIFTMVVYVTKIESKYRKD